MIYINFVDLHSLMFHAKFQNHRPSGSEEEDFEEGFCHLWWPSWSCDLDYLCILSFSIPNFAPNKVWL